MLRQSASSEGSAQVISPLVFLQHRVRALPLAGRTVGDVLDEAIAVFENPPPDLMDRFSALSDELRDIGIRLMHPIEDEDPPLHGLVRCAQSLVKAYPALARQTETLTGLCLYRGR